MLREELENYTIGKPNVIVLEELRRLCLCRYIYINYFKSVEEKREANEIIERILKYAKEEGELFSAVIGRILDDQEWADGFNIQGIYYEGLNRLVFYLINGGYEEEQLLSREIKNKAQSKVIKILSKNLNTYL